MELTSNKSQRIGSRGNCLFRWWNQDYPHQKRLESFFEHSLFHLLITILVTVECAAIIIEILLYNLKNQYECHIPPYASKDYIHKKTHHLEYGMEICHYLSLSILSIFICELFLKIYALGFHYWNCKENHKLDYFDAFLVIFSFTLEIYFLVIDKDSIIAHSAILIVILRLWHLLRVANAVAQCFQKGTEFKAIRRQHHFERYARPLFIPESVQAILDLMQEKTEYLRRDISIEQSLLDRFEYIDNKCEDLFEDYYGNETKLVEEIQKLHFITRKIQNKDKQAIIVEV